MAAPERDDLTGRYTTGHEWDGIKELSTPIPGWWVGVFLISIAVALLYMVLYPSFASTERYYEGALKYSSTEELRKEVVAARAAQAPMRNALVETPLEEIEADDALRRFATTGGQAAFNENCAACHGVGAGGQIGQFPALVDDDWIWGGRIADIRQTILYGIRSAHPDTRQSLMPVFGQILTPEQISQTAAYVKALSDPAADATRSAMPGAPLFAANCASCHGAEGQGGRDFGAPRLNDAIWLYGSSQEAIERQIANPRMGVMPAFGDRLDESTVRMIAVYVHTLGGGEK
ncbi:cytochrome-c oxidase, cbb3-type subunit III [Tistrella mobilis]|uniref:Cbb3-type cytochrome c oxidase subunit n=1 Tax=Tistrella mobilis (strain KA081020-065) TaxID=1110502 RepID=I3TMY2_TISMK|nr:cytochrome-c oxidase, cbb3-type subunit III [Tistrella mobilis]AFK54120.1 cytochrome-c oxidase fixP chain [Tistrella mobilis KA081020-065]